MDSESLLWRIGRCGRDGMEDADLYDSRRVAKVAPTVNESSNQLQVRELSLQVFLANI